MPFTNCNRSIAAIVVSTWAISNLIGSTALGHDIKKATRSRVPAGVGSESARRDSTSDREAPHRPLRKISISGIYPHLAYWNSHNECGTGAVVPWAGRLWVVTYSPHSPNGSTDRLYEISPDLDISAFADSVGGTPANRMIHRETNQLLIGPYVIDAGGNVRVIPPNKMYGRLTGNARHLFEPEDKVYYATMEEGFYEVDMRTLEVTELFRDNQRQVGGHPAEVESDRPLIDLPGYHGKGLYSGQGRLIYANNGEHSEEARRRPDVPSGCLAEWDGTSEKWTVIRRNQFTDVRGPGGLFGNLNPDTDPVWAVGWDHRSVLLMLLDEGNWYTYRLPKATHTYDGAHGWNTEWPRIRDIGEDDFAMTMHGMFWRFPKSFCRRKSDGISPRSTYLKVIGDFCRWGDRLVFGCDDTAKSEFLNTRRAKGKIAAPGRSHSNLWFTDPSILDELGPPIGRGAIWIDDAVTKNVPSDPFLFSGFERRSVHIAHDSGAPVTFTFEVDVDGSDQWQPLTTVTVAAKSSAWHAFESSDQGIWLRVSVDQDCENATVAFHYAHADSRSTESDPMFDGLTTPTSKDFSGGLVRVRGDDLRTLGFAATQIIDGNRSKPKFYELDAEMNLTLMDDPKALEWTFENVPIPEGVVSVDAASAIYVDDAGKRWRLPKGDAAFDSNGPLGFERTSREVVTERDLFNCHGSFYELPARNAGGFAKTRPICTHNRRIKDYCSYRGMVILSGVVADTRQDNSHVVRSNDGRVALWAGVVDDLWKLGKPGGIGGPWNGSHVTKGEPSDPYLMTGYDRKTMQLAHRSSEAVDITAEVDVTGTGMWMPYRIFTVPSGEAITHQFPTAFNAYWIRFTASQDTTATAMLTYE